MNETNQHELEQPPRNPLLERLEMVMGFSELAAEFFRYNWEECRDGLLQQTKLIEVTPHGLPSPAAFDFTIHTPYKRKLGADASVELVPGPLAGRILYRPDMFEEPEGATVLVLIDRSLGLYHPNYSREQGFLCIGNEDNLPPGPIPLDQLLSTQIYSILTYQNYRPTHPADLEAARYFALEPTALEGLTPARPLY